MNDPGLDEPITEEAEVIDDAVEENETFLSPSRWWMASTAFPLAAGTFGPMASAFSICALTVHWRVWIPPGGVEEHGNYIEDPAWLVAINAVQLAIACVSNMFLLLNMARKVSFSVAQPITILGWYTSSFALIGLTATAAGPLKLPSPPAHAYTQGFYYAIFAAILYFIVASMMVVTVIGARRGCYDREFQLTTSQRTLMLQTISFLVYLLAGAAVFAHIEEWNYLDAVYWADVTLLTVGLGDYSPSTHLGRSLLIPYAIGGIIILGLVIGSIRSLVLERAKVKLSRRELDKERKSLLRRLERQNSDILKPVDDAESEVARREQEYRWMRKAQRLANVRRRWISLIISGTTWFVLWLVGAAVFKATERGQQWTYFESVYFAYTSLLTIGYGDFYPQSNSGKPFFVFWSLLAVPSLTILIGNMGDTVVAGIKEATLLVGHYTLLPGDKKSVREIIKRIKRGGDQECGLTKQEAVPRDATEYHQYLIEEIITVMSHLHKSPPHSYSYEEWCRYLKLVGMDESEARRHESPPRKVSPDESLQTKGKWSWLGHQSPLMGSKEEAQWVLDRLTHKLRDELRQVRRRALHSST